MLPASITSVPRLWRTVRRLLIAISHALASTSSSAGISCEGSICRAICSYPARPNIAGSLRRSCVMVHRSGLPVTVASSMTLTFVFAGS